MFSGRYYLAAMDAANATRFASWHTQREEQGQDPAMAGGLRDPVTEGLSPNLMCVTTLLNQQSQLASFASLVGRIRRLSPDRVYNRGWFVALPYTTTQLWFDKTWILKSLLSVKIKLAGIGLELEYARRNDNRKITVA